MHKKSNKNTKDSILSVSDLFLKESIVSLSAASIKKYEKIFYR